MRNALSVQRCSAPVMNQLRTRYPHQRRSGAPSRSSSRMGTTLLFFSMLLFFISAPSQVGAVDPSPVPTPAPSLNAPPPTPRPTQLNPPTLDPTPTPLPTITATGGCPAGDFLPCIGCECTACAAGQFQPDPGYTGSICIACNPGTFGPDPAMKQCTPCPAGTSTANIGKTICATCTAGKYSFGTGNSGCTFCAQVLLVVVEPCFVVAQTNFTLHTLTTPHLTPIPHTSQGQYSPTSGATSSATCQECPGGTYAAEVGRVCVGGGWIVICV